MSGAGVDGNAPYQAQELQITTLANLGIQTNFLPPSTVVFFKLDRGDSLLDGKMSEIISICEITT